MLRPRVCRTIQPAKRSCRSFDNSCWVSAVTIRFTPSFAKYIQAKKHVIVSGELVTTGVRGNAVTEQRTYEMGLTVENYHVVLDELQVSKGAPKPSDIQ